MMNVIDNPTTLEQGLFNILHNPVQSLILGQIDTYPPRTTEHAPRIAGLCAFRPHVENMFPGAARSLWPCVTAAPEPINGSCIFLSTRNLGLFHIFVDAENGAASGFMGQVSSVIH